MWKHTANRSPEHLGWCSEVEGSSTGWVEASLLAQESLVLQLRAKELSGYVESFASDDDYLLTIEQLLGHCASQATEEVSLAVDNDDWFKGRHPARLL